MYGQLNRSKLFVLVMLILAVSVIPTLAQGNDDPDPAANKALVTEFFETVSGKEKPVEVLQQYIAEDSQARGLIEVIAMIEAGFPQYEIVAEDMVAEEDKVAVRATVRGTHEGEFLGIPPTGNSIEIAVFLFYRIEDGKIVEFWMQADDLGVMQQLGVLPPPAPAP